MPRRVQPPISGAEVHSPLQRVSGASRTSIYVCVLFRLCMLSFLLLCEIGDGALCGAEGYENSRGIASSVPSLKNNATSMEKQDETRSNDTTRDIEPT